MEFCKQFNAPTQKVEKGLPIPVIITVYRDRSFTFIMKTPPASVLIRKAIGIEKGSGTPNTAKVGKITRKQLEEIAKTKTPDLTAADLDAAVRTIAGSARAWASTWRSKSWQSQNVKRPGPNKIQPGKQYPIDDALKLVKEFATAKFNETVDVRRESRHRRREVRPAGARLDRDAARHGQDGARRGVHRRQERRAARRPPAPTSSAWKTSPRR